MLGEVFLKRCLGTDWSLTIGDSRAGSDPTEGENRPGSVITGDKWSGSLIIGDNRLGSLTIGDNCTGSLTTGDNCSGSLITGDNRLGSGRSESCSLAARLRPLYSISLRIASRILSGENYANQCIPLDSHTILYLSSLEIYL